MKETPCANSCSFSLSCWPWLVAVTAAAVPFQLPGQPQPAAVVNGKVIARADYDRQVELATTYLKTQGVDDTTEDGKLMLSQMKDEVLHPDDRSGDHQSGRCQGRTGRHHGGRGQGRSTETVEEAGGQSVLDEWLKTSGFTWTSSARRSASS